MEGKPKYPKYEKVLTKHRMFFTNIPIRFLLESNIHTDKIKLKFNPKPNKLTIDIEKYE